MTMLPLQKSKIKEKLSEHVILVYGRPKIGKSTFGSYFEDAIFLATEPLNDLEVFKVNVNSWNKPLEKDGENISGGFLSVCFELAKKDHTYKTIIIDTIDNLVTYCNIKGLIKLP